MPFSARSGTVLPNVYEAPTLILRAINPNIGMISSSGLFASCFIAVKYRYSKSDRCRSTFPKSAECPGHYRSAARKAWCGTWTRRVVRACSTGTKARAPRAGTTAPSPLRRPASEPAGLSEISVSSFYIIRLELQISVQHAA